MTVRIQSGTTVFVNSGQTVQTPQVQNAGTITNAGTTQQFRSNVASGSGSGIGTAKSFPPTTRASGIGDAVGTAIDTRVKTVSAGVPQPDIQVNPSSTREIERDEISQAVEIRNAGTITNAGTTRVSQAPPREGIGEGIGTARTSPIPFPRAAGLGEAIGDALTARQTPKRANGIGEGIGTAIQTPVFTSIASGFGEGLGTAGTRFDNITSASGVGQATGTATKQFQRFPVAAGIGQAAGQATTNRFNQIIASGSGSGLGLARNPLPFDAVAQIVNLLNETNDSRWRYGKPERIDPIWEYSHNDRINFPNPALYVYTPSDASIDKFGIEGESFNQTITIEILVMTLEATETQAYISETAELITQLYDDNTANSNFHRFGNINLADLRNEHVPQQTDHYIGTVTFEIQRFAAIPALQSVGAFR
ncbi:hypothetical protein OSG_eHP24_00125 [environmental Halophage eHP-24]|nr:hypothetical protein OSG_eHP24_00125 [environmental Halophage eHP-24]